MGAFVFSLPNSTDHMGCFAGQYVIVSMCLCICHVGTILEWKQEEGRWELNDIQYIIMVTMIKVLHMVLNEGNYLNKLDHNYFPKRLT